jgi:PAS domain S-box-containing protein
MEVLSPQIGKQLKIGNLTIIANCTPLVAEGNVLGVVGTFQEIADLEKIANQLPFVKQLENVMNTMIEWSYDGIQISDGQANVLRVNASFEKLTGIRSSEMVGRNMSDLVREGWVSRSVTLMVLERGELVTTKALSRNKRNVLLTGTPIYDEAGNISMVLTTVRDITDLTRLNRQLRRSKQITEEYQAKLQKIQDQHQSDFELIARSKAMADVLDLALRIAAVDTSVLIQGETGVGKEVVARFIHARSPRAERGTFMKINCGAIPDHLLESELFGYEKGAFTGASQTGKKGLFELADNGTIFLDEIEALSLNLQVKLLNVAQDLEILPVGGTKSKKINTRIIAASNRDLHEMIQDKTFREDLFFRLNVVPIYIPPLRERKEDILPLIIYFVEKYNSKYGRNRRLARTAIDCLIQYPWPGNTRELSNIIERLVITSRLTDIVLDDLPVEVVTATASLPTTMFGTGSLKEAVERFECGFIQDAIRKYGNAKKAAAVLKVDPATISRKIRRRDIIE